MANKKHLEMLRQERKVWNTWREINPDIKFDLSEADLRGADLSGTNLSEADLRGANLMKTDLRGAYLRGAYLMEANLIKADLRGTNLSEVDLRGANLSGTNLSGANLTETYLTGANLTEANLTATNLTETNLTGACIKNWNISNKTVLKNIKCDYIFLKSTWNNNKGEYMYYERRPHQKNKIFQNGDFEQLVKKSQETVDLIFRNGINWKAFLNSYEQLKIEARGKFLPIQSFENKEDGSFIVRIRTPPELDKAEIEKYFEDKYKQELQLIESKYRLQLKDVEIESYKRENTNLSEITKMLANKPTNIGAHFMATNNPETFNNYQQEANIANNANIVKDNARQQANQYNYTLEEKQSLAEAATEIQELLDQFSKTYSETEAEQKVAEDLANRARQNPSFKEQLKTWSQSLLSKGTEAGVTELAKEGAKRVIPLALTLLI